MSDGSANPLGVTPEEFVRFDAFGPFDDATEWHVNRHLGIADEEGPARLGYALQRADGREQWLTIAYQRDDDADDGWSVHDAAIMDDTGRMTPITDEFDLVAVADTKEGLA